MENKKMQTEQTQQTNVNVTTKEWANPTSAGLVALAVACACFFALLTGRVDKSAMPLVGAWLIGGFIIQLIVGLLDLKSGNLAGGNTFLFFSAFFMLVGGIEMLLKYKALTAGTPLDARIDGYAWVILTLVVFLWTPAFFKKFSLLSLVVAFLDIALPFIALTDLGVIPKSYSHVAAWALLCAGLTAVYLCSANIVNGTYGKKIYPLP